MDECVYNWDHKLFNIDLKICIPSLMVQHVLVLKSTHPDNSASPPKN